MDSFYIDFLHYLYSKDTEKCLNLLSCAISNGLDINKEIDLKTYESLGLSKFKSFHVYKTLLLTAVYMRNIDIVYLLLKNGAIITDLVLSLSVLYAKNSQCLRLLIEYGGKINKYLIFETIQSVRLTCLQELLSNGVDVNVIRSYTEYDSESDDDITMFETPFLCAMKLYERCVNQRVAAYNRTVSFMLLSTRKIDFTIPENKEYLHLLNIDEYANFEAKISWKRRRHLIINRKLNLI